MGQEDDGRLVLPDLPRGIFGKGENLLRGQLHHGSGTLELRGTPLQILLTSSRAAAYSLERPGGTSFDASRSASFPALSSISVMEARRLTMGITTPTSLYAFVSYV
jgi:hypothetical protein